MVSILNGYILSGLQSTAVVAIMPKVKKSRRKSEALCQMASVRMTSGSQAPSRTAGKSTGNFSETIVNRLRQAYSKAADGAKAMQMKRYMRDQFEFYGLSAPERRAIDKQVLDDLTSLEVESLRQLLRLLWQQPQREFQLCGTDLAIRCWQVLAGEEEGRCKTSLDCVKELITTKSWWDTVDMLASNVVGEFVLRYPTTMVPVMEEWVEDENLWLRRTAILHQLKAKHNTNQGRLFRMCLQCCHEKEFFIQKAIGWALREHHKLHPQDVREFVQDNRHRLAKLSQQEALKHA
ncbi:PREDICTED: uncharacterized protein LOC109483750 [Branchiostoma belcheri]|uniref:Uncharacterized protein LOC109483750 n=1 Tax=Branchiostoma belcheri TaxID=7741 RepID=A0A6P4ZZI7_BRABE|nr:PREDICTED: uncharacterized protein LOC109483750 [Branchiostoma belcheri]